MESVMRYLAVLSVRVAADESASGMSQGEFADRLYELLARPEWRWERAVRIAARVVPCPQWAVITLFNPDQGFAFAYFYAGGEGSPGMVVGGLLDGPVDVPMPVTVGTGGSVMGLRCGCIECTAAIEDTIDYLGEMCRRDGLLPVPDGWELDFADLRSLARSLAPDFVMVQCPERHID